MYYSNIIPSKIKTDTLQIGQILLDDDIKFVRFLPNRLTKQIMKKNVGMNVRANK